MTSIKHTLWLIFASAILIAADNSTCPTNLNSVCTILPFNINNSPDVWLNVPNLSVDKITLLVENLTAMVSVAASAASLVSINAGVDVTITTVNLTITGVKAQVQLAVYLDNVAAIVKRALTTLQTLPSLVQAATSTLTAANSVVPTVVRTRRSTHQIIDNAGQIIDQVLNPAGDVVSSVVIGNYQSDMILIGIVGTLANGNTIVQYSYTPPADSSQTNSILVNIVFDPQNNPVSTTIVDPSSTATNNAAAVPLAIPAV